MMAILHATAPTGGATHYDRSHLMIYAELLDADRRGVTWEEGASDILGIDPVIEPEAARLRRGNFRAQSSRLNWWSSLVVPGVSAQQRGAHLGSGAASPPSSFPDLG